MIPRLDVSRGPPATRLYGFCVRSARSAVKSRSRCLRSAARLIGGLSSSFVVMLAGAINPFLDLRVASLTQHLSAHPGLNIPLPFFVGHHEHLRPKRSALGAQIRIQDERDALFRAGAGGAISAPDRLPAAGRTALHVAAGDM